MNERYGKIYEKTFEGSMYAAGPVVFAVWSFVIAKLKPPGVVRLNPRSLAATLGATVKEIETALAYLCAPDPGSDTKTHGGRRLIKQGEFEYMAPTYERYRNGTDEERKAANAARQAKHRAKVKEKKAAAPILEKPPTFTRAGAALVGRNVVLDDDPGQFPTDIATPHFTENDNKYIDLTGQA